MKSFKEQFTIFKKNNPQLLTYRNRRRSVLATKILFFDVVIVVITILCATRYSAAIWVGIAAVILLPLWLFKPWQYFKSNWIGIINEISYKDRQENISKNPADTRYTSQHTVTYILCRVNTEKNKRATFMLDSKYDSVYHIGDTVMRISGLDYPINMSEGKQIVCSKCGNIMPKESERCVECDLPTVIMR